MENRYHKYIKKALEKFAPEIKTIIYKIETIDNLKKYQNISEKDINKDSSIKTKKTSNISANLTQNTQDPDTNLNSKYTFDNLVIGSHNELAHAATLAVIDNLGIKYNPLFIYGGVGLGKTHLIQALGNTVKVNNKKINI